MKNLFLINFLVLVLLFVAKTEYCEAQFVGEDKATIVATNFFRYNSKNIETTEANLVYTQRTSDETVAWYAFNMNPEGYVIVSADERLFPIIAYSENSSFNLESFDDASSFSYWMDTKTLEIQEILKLSPPQTNKNAIRWSQLLTNSFEDWESRAGSVLPLLTSTWGQDCYYNEMCPVDAAAPSANCGHALVGCTATAIGQIMYYWKHPVSGNGSTTYTSSNYGVITADYGNTTYEWNQMANSISSSNLSVAELLFHVGVSIESIYGPNGTSGRPWLIDDALINNFGYSDEAEMRYRSSYSDEEWINMLKLNLDNGRPIYYQGSDTVLPAAHAFVIDGYDENGLFHVNWGWKGLANGYFYIDDLSPYYFDYSANHLGFFNIYPDNSSVKEMLFNDFNAYPIPVKDNMFVEADIVGDAIISIVDSNGKICLSKSIEVSDDSKVSLDLSNFDAGLYLVVIINEGKTLRKKIVKQ